MPIRPFRSPVVLSLAILAVLCCLSAGCSRSSSVTTAVSGTITVNGKPLTKGAITFQSAYGGQTSVGTITEGAYSIPADQGPYPGDQIVRILAFRDGGTAKAPSSDMPAAPKPAASATQEQYLPARFNTSSELKANLGAFENKNVNFDLQTE